MIDLRYSASNGLNQIKNCVLIIEEILVGMKKSACFVLCSLCFFYSAMTGQAADLHGQIGSVKTEDITDSEEGDLKTGNGIPTQCVEEILAGLTLQEKVAQLFVVTPEALTGADSVTMAGETTAAAFSSYPVGGIIYMEPNIQTWEQTSEMLSAMQDISDARIGLPVFLCVDEEGGNVRRVSGRIENTPYIPEMLSVGNTKDPLQAYKSGTTIGAYLRQLGFNVDFAPVADVLTNPDNTVIGSRSFGSDPNLAASMVSLEVKGLQEEGICATLKHFPGHGNTSEDSHQGAAVSYKTLEELKSCELIPFESGITAGADLVMAGHIAFPSITGDHTPASLSHYFLTDLLREQMGFDGVIITDALSMGAVTNLYGSGEAAVQAFLAGSDLLLMPADFQSAYAAVLNEVGAGRISEERLEESLRRIISLKLRQQEQSAGIQSEEAAVDVFGGQQVQDGDDIQQVPYSDGSVTVEEGFDGVIIEE